MSSQSNGQHESEQPSLLPPSTNRVPYRKVLVGACGAINVINLHSYLIALCTHAVAVQVVLTEAALRMVQRAPIQAITGNPVYANDATNGLPVPHNNLATWADLFIILPASANTLAKAAHGIADDLLTTTILAATPPVWFVPSMNQRMWQKAAVQRNVHILEGDGHRVIRCTKANHILELSSGETATTELMPSPSEICETIFAFLEDLAHRAPA